MVIAAIVGILQLLEPGISGNKSILRQYCRNIAAHMHLAGLSKWPTKKAGSSVKSRMPFPIEIFHVHHPV